jgi:hypothetical protein
MSPFRRRAFRIEEFQQQVRTRLESRFGLRLHMTGLLAVVFVTAYLTTRGLSYLGVTSMALRYGMATAVGYGAFFGLVRLWTLYVAGQADTELTPAVDPEEIAAQLDPDRPSTPNLEREAARDGGRVNPSHVRGSFSQNIDGGFGDASYGSSGGGTSSSSGGGSSGNVSGSGIDGDGAVAIIVIAVIALVLLALFGIAGYLIYSAPSILGEIAIEAILASVLTRSSRKIVRPGWGGSVLAATWLPALGVLVVVVLGGAILQGVCEGPTTLGGVIAQCVRDGTAKP